MTIHEIKEAGEYLGFCEQKGYIYSVFIGRDGNGVAKYSVCALKDGNITVLITHYVK